MASDESTELVRFVTEGEVLYRPGDLRITITLSDACIAAGQRAAADREELLGCRVDELDAAIGS